MNKPLQIGLLAAVIVIALGGLGFFLMKGGGTSGAGGTWSDEQRQVRDALDKVGNDPSKLDPTMKARYDKVMAENPFNRARTEGAPGSAPSAGSLPR